MAGCRSTLKLLPLLAGGDLDAARGTKVMRHLVACVGCSAQAAQYLQVKNLTRQLHRSDEGLPDEVRIRLARQAASMVQSRRGLRDWLGFPLELAPRPAMAVATLAAAFVFFVSLSLVRHDRGESPVSPGSDSIQLDVAYDDGSVRLAWKDGRRDSYRVYRSEDPRGLTGVQPRVVEGRAWVDASHDTSPIIYYRIE